MSEGAIVHRLNVIVVLVVAVLAVLLWPVLSEAVFLLGVALFLLVACGLVWSLAQSV